MIVLFLGGSRSGKSELAEALATKLAEPTEEVTYMATMHTLAEDTDLDERITIHRDRRPTHWHTVEPPYDLARVLAETKGVVLLDSLATWFSSHEIPPSNTALADALTSRKGDTVIVSDEVGMGVHPPTQAGREFRDGLGQLNQAVAAVADQVYLAVAGRVLPLSRFNLDFLTIEEPTKP